MKPQVLRWIWRIIFCSWCRLEGRSMILMAIWIQPQDLTLDWRENAKRWLSQEICSFLPLPKIAQWYQRLLATDLHDTYRHLYAEGESLSWFWLSLKRLWWWAKAWFTHWPYFDDTGFGTQTKRCGRELWLTRYGKNPVTMRQFGQIFRIKLMQNKC